MKHNIDNQILRKLNMTVIRLYNSSARSSIWLLLLMVIVVGNTTTSMAGVVIKGNVYGGGNAADVGTDVTINISAGQIGDTQIDDEHGNVFGGGKGQVTTVVGNVKVNIGKKVTIDNEQEVVSYSNNDKVTIKGSIYGGSALGAVNGTKANDWDENHLDRISATSNKTTEVNICAGVVNGNVYGGGRGALAVGTEGQTGYIAPIEAKSFGAVDVSIGIATASAATTTPVIEGSVYGGSNINGTLENSARLDIISGTIGKENTSEGDNPVTTITGGNVHGGGFGQPTLVKGSVIVNIGVETNATPAVHYGYASILADVYGGSAKGNVNATATENNENPLALTTGATTQVNLYGGTVSGDLYGGGLGDNTTNAEIAANVYGPVTVSTKDGTVRNVFGCNNLYGAPKSTVNVNIDGGTISNDVYGGGNLANTTASPNVSVTNGTVSRDVYGGGALANTGGSTVNITGGTITRDIYGGGLGDADHAAAVNGAVLVNIGSMQPGANEGDAPTYSGNATIGGSVYGCNNANGSPTGNVLVNIYKTAHTNTPINNLYPNGITTLDGLNSLSNDDNRFAIKAVYGGGNLAHYTPVAPTGNNPVHSTTVHVYGCSENTVKAVYGGGNAADVGTSDVMANTNVIIEGGRYDIVFGGGNGYSETGNHSNPAAANYNPGANIFGTATTEIQGGLYNQIYGGSNQLGNVTATSLTINMLCNDLLIDKSFGGANEANITGDVTTTLACSDIKIGSFYGGSNKANIIGNVTLNVEGGTYTDIFGGSRGVADDPSTEEDESISADISGDVTLNLYGGTMDNAFGGSDINGLIGGKITVNMLNKGVTGCGLTVHNIYGGGRDAAYTPTTPGAYPEVNLIHGTVSKNNGSGGNVFGGGLGSTATVTSSPKVNVGYNTSMSTLVTSLLPVNTQFTTAIVSVEGDVYGGGEEAAVTGGTTVTVQQGTAEGMTITTAVGGDVYGGGALANVGTSASDATQVNIAGGTITGNVYGGGLGRLAVEDNPVTNENEEVSAIAALVNGAVTVTVSGGKATNVFGCNNINGAPQSTVTVNVTGTDTPTSPANYTISNVYGGGNVANYTGTPIVTVSGSSYVEKVFGGGNEASVGGTNVTISTTANTESATNSRISNVYGGGNQAGVTGNTLVSMTSGNVLTAMYGGCNTSGTVGGTATVSVTGGTIGTAFASAPASMDAIPQVLFGGGKGASTTVTGKTTLNVGAKSGSTYSGTATIYGNVYGGSENGVIGDVDVNLYGSSSGTTNTIYGNVFGGGYDTSVTPAEGTLAKHVPAAGTVNVLLDGAKFDRSGTFADNTNMAQIFGCNNKNGTPTGLVTVHVKRTTGSTKTSGTSIANRNSYDVYAVYGGGNMADYKPTNLVDNANNNTKGDSTFVLIEGCDLTSIQYVYGGGNAAAVPASGVSIKGTYIIYKVFGGGNGAGQIPGPNNNMINNPGANVGSYITTGTTTQSYGRGTAVTKLYGGTINEVYGGSNTLGDVRKVIVETKTPEGTTPDCCTTLNVINVYGAGSEAEMTGDVNLIMECMPEDYVDAVYGGAKNAIINGNVEITVTSGKFGRVFGGNNMGGSINGTITVNVYEDGCKPLIIGELFGAGNNAPYSIFGCTPPAANSPAGTPWTPNTEAPEDEDPYVLETADAVSVNVFSCTSIGKVYGGGKGSTAKVIGNTHVWINMLNGIIDGTPKTKEDNPNDYIGKIGQVFGGGSAADVKGNTTIDIGTATVHPNIENKDLIGVNIIPGTDYLSPNTNTNVSITDAGIYGGGEAADVDGNTTLNIGRENLSEGTNITGNIYGGGLGSGTHVTGNVQVNIGKSVTTEGVTSYVGYANITGDVYGGSAKGKVNSYLNNSNVETLTDGATTQVNLYGGTITGNVYGGGLGDASNAADVYGAVTVNVKGGSANNVFGCNNENGTPKSTVAVNINGGRIYQSVYGGGNQAIMDGSPVVNVTAGTIGTDNEGNTVYGGARYGNVYGGGLGSNGTGTQTDLQKVMAGLVKGNTEINISGGTILHNIYGGGAYGSVGTYTYDNSTSMPTGLATANTGKATIYITGGTIGTDGNENGMVFGSSRGDVGAPDAIHDKLAWVYDTHVVIGDTTANATVTTSTPLIKGSVYGGGENGHNFNDASVRINGGTIGITEGASITDNNNTTYTGAAYPYRGNVYGAGCGTDKYWIDADNDQTVDDGEKHYNPLAGIVQGNVLVNITGGHVVHNIYGAGAMGSVGTADVATSGLTKVSISDGTVGVSGTVGDGNVFGAARGSADAISNEYALVRRNTNVTVSGGTINGNVYGGGELGCVGRYVISNDMRNFYWTNTPLASITPSDPTTFPYNNTGVCNVNVTGSTASIKGHVFGGGKGKEDTFWCEKGIAYKTNVTITNGTVDHNVYGGGQVGRVENDATVKIGPDSGTGSPEIKGDVFGAGAGVETHGYSALVRGNTYVTIQSSAKVHENVYGGGELAAVGKYYLVDQDYLDSHSGTALEIGMPYSLVDENLGVCNVTIKGSAEIGYNGTGHLYGGGKGKVPSYYLDNTVSLSDTTQMPKRMMSYNSAVYNKDANNAIKDLWGYTDASHSYVWEYFDTRAKYHTFLETLALATRTVVSVEGSAKVNGSVYGGSQSGFVQHNTSVTIKESSTIGKSTGGTVTGGDVYGGGLGLEIFEHAGRVSGNSTVNINGGNILNSVYGGGAYGIVRQNVTVNVSGGTVTNDVYGGGALADTNTDNWNSATEALADNSYSEVTGLTTGTSSVTGLYTRSGSEGSYTYTLITDVTAKAASGTTYYENAAYKTIVSLTGGTVGNAYGGGLGRLASSSVSEVAAMVYGDVTVTVDGTVFHQQTESEKEAVTYKEDNQDITTKVTKYGRVFGANNVNGTPKGNILVHVKQTVPENGGEHEYDHYEIHSVYGGGNQADYLPVSGRNTQVLIEDCGATSIQYVYGGGNSASVPQTLVTVNGCFEIGMIFGGGNGEDPVQNTSGVWEANPGADVKHSDGTAGTGTINAHGGIIRWLYGGSNKKGLCGTITENLRSTNPYCPLKITNVYGAGKNADVEEVFIVAKCPGENVEYLYGGSYNAHITRGVTLTLIGGRYKNVYGGNDSGGTIGGNIEVNIQETLDCAPIIIDNLYGGGNNAEYPGNGGTGGSITVNVKSCTYIGNIYGGGRGEGAIVNGNTAVNINMTKGLWAGSSTTTNIQWDKMDVSKSDAEIIAAIQAEIPNITVSNVYGTATTVGSVTKPAKSFDCTVKNELGTIGNVYGGGDEAAVHGNVEVNIGSASTVAIMQHDDDGVPVDENGNAVFDGDGKLVSGKSYTDIDYHDENVLGARITGNVYGGGNLADVTLITNVNICADDDDDDTEYTAVSEGTEGVTIRGSVYGGGKGRADNFECDKAMVGTNDHGEDAHEGNTYVRIGNGTVRGNVYGGGKVGRVESHTNVTIGYGDGVASGSTPISAPVITGYVFGAGEGVATHGYSGLVRGNSTVTIQGNAEIGQSVYGGGQKATVGRFWVKNVNDGAYEHKTDYPNVPTGMPYARMSGGACSVTVQGYAKIGPDDMQMPTFSGHVFGAGKGLTPYLDTDTEEGSGVGQGPGRWYAPDGVYTWQSYAGDNKESDYLGYIQTLALADATDVTIAGHAFIKGSVYGGSENGRVLDNTSVKIQENCQIGNGWNPTLNNNAGGGINRPYNSTEWAYDVTSDDTEFLYECNSWPYTSPYAPYDKFNYGGGSENATDGHTFYGNVFGGGSGYFPYASGKWHSEAGAVGGNTTVTITGGHILTSVYGGNELTDVTGSCTVNFGGTATLGVPRTLTQIANHPVTCYLFGAGKGDQRTHFNTWTNVNSATVNVTGGIIYGSVFGGGEDGHILENAAVNISDNTKETSHVNTMIGTWGTSYVDGNVFGGGRGFSGEAQTAGTVGGNVTVTISGGTMLGSIYGGGRLASVGTYFTAPNANEYGQLKEDGNGKTYGHITLNIYGGTIGGGKAGSADDLEAHRYDMGYSGNVYGGCMGRITQIDGVTINPIWPELAQSKFSTVNIYGNNTHITRNVYGGAEFGVVRENAKVTIGGKQEETGTTITEVSTPTVDGYVYGGGHGSDDYQHPTTIEVYWGGTQRLFTYTPMQWTGCVGGNTTVNLAGGSVKRIYGGGELASVGVIDYGITENANGEFTYKDKKYSYTNMVKHESLTNGFGLSWPYKFTYVPCNPSNFIGGLATVNVTGGTVTEYVYGGGQGKVAFTGVNDIEQQRYTEAFCANVKETQVTIGKSDSDDTPVIGPGSLTSAASVYGGGEDGHVLEDASVIINKGTIGHSVFGGGKGVSTYTATLLDPTKDTPTPKGSSESVHSWTAGKVYGNTNVTMNGGSVGWFIYGGGNMASVGKGNYTGGSDDYSTGGYGETITGNLWTSAFDPNEAVSESNKPDDAYYFLSSGKATVNLFGGTVGDADATAETAFTPTDKLPYGSVFGGSRGTAAMDVDDKSPRYKYVPDSYCGYVNKTVVNIGGTTTDGAVAGDGPTILGSVYCGAQDGHVRNSTEVRIFKGNIAGRSAEVDAAGRSGHVFGAGSGIGTYGDNKVSYSSGSVTCTTLVEMNGGSIHGNIWGGGAMASVGPQMIGSKNEQHAVTEGSDHKSVSYTRVDVKGGSVGGNVYGASRGPSDAYLTTIFGSAENYDKTKFATDIWSFVNVTGGTVSGSVYGGGEGGIVKHDTEVSLTGGTITNDAYGGGKGTKYIDANVNGNTTVELNKDKTGISTGCAVNRIFGCNDYKGTPKGHVLVHVYATQKAGGSNISDKFALRMQRSNETSKAYLTRLINIAKPSGSAYLKGVDAATITEAETIRDKANPTDAELETAISNVNAAINASSDVYDVQAVYGGGNLAPYEPYGPNANNTEADYKATEERTKVIIDGCQLTSIKQVYGGGNAAPVPASYVEVNGTYEIDEVFGGGNGADNYIFNDEWYQNPGANVGYYNYTQESTSGTTPGTENNPYYLAVEKTDAATKELRQQNYRYGTGIATTHIKGGKVHTVYGGSNKKGNISTIALSKYESMNEDCPIDIDESYGGGKDAPIDGTIQADMLCAKGVKELFGGSKNSDVNSDIVLNITNGSSLERVFGGNNTSGAIAGSITVNIEEGGCEPIHIGELYLGGYLAPYSVYGYEDDGQGGYATYTDENGIEQRKPILKDASKKVINETEVTFKGWETKLDSQEKTYKKYLEDLITSSEAWLDDPANASSSERSRYEVQHAALNERLHSYPKKDPRINIISASRIDNVYGGGYQALVVGNPHVNVNMTMGKVIVEKKEKETGDASTYAFTENGKTYVYKDASGTIYNNNLVNTADLSYQLPIGSIGNIYGGGNKAAVYGNTFVEIGTGEWLNKDDQREMLGTTDNISNPTVFTYKMLNEQATSEQWTYVQTTTTTTTNPETQEEETTTTSETVGITGTPTPVRYTAKIDGDVFGGGNLGDIGQTHLGTDNDGKTIDVIDSKGSTYVTIGAKKAVVNNEEVWQGVAEATMVEDNDHNVTGVSITGNVYGGGQGQATTFRCGDAMVTDGTNIVIGNGTLKRIQRNIGTEQAPIYEWTGNVFGGGKIGRVEGNTSVTIGLGDGVASGTPASAPVIESSVFGAGAGVNTHGYSALVRGSSTVTVQGNAKIGTESGSVYGGGEVASVGRYNIGTDGLPVTLYDESSPTSGHCTVTVKGYAEIGPDNMKMDNGVDNQGNPLPPDDTGYIFGAGKGVLPFENITDPDGRPGRMILDGSMEYYYTANPDKICTTDYSKYLRTLALATQTDVTVTGHAFVKGAVYGGAENGFVQHDTHVVIDGDCQIGNGHILLKDPTTGSVIFNRGVNRRYTDAEWAAGKLTVTNDDFTAEERTAHPNIVSLVNTRFANSLPECASWDYDKTSGAPYDRYATYKQTVEGKDKYYYNSTYTDYAEGGAPVGKDGHTFFGNVFGGGSGYWPYAPGKWYEYAGSVYGNIIVDIKGGHILTSVYGGNELTNVGTYQYSVTTGEQGTKTSIELKSGGNSYVTMTGGTIGVPRTVDEIKAHPLTCYLFGAGKGDQRVFFNTATNVGNAFVHVSDNARIFGNVFGGGEDGHVIKDVELSIGSKDLPATLPTKSVFKGVTTLNGSTDVTVGGKTINYPYIGMTGTSYLDGNVFGAGRGFSGEALTAGSVGGNVDVNIQGGTMLGSVYGGGRLASVGTLFINSGSPYYGQLQEDVAEDIHYTQEEINAAANDESAPAHGKTTNDIKTPAQSHGHITINISGGTIGNDVEDILVKHTKGGNVFGGSMGRLKMLDDATINPLWPKLAVSKTTKVNISGTALIKGNVYGGGEYSMVRGDTYVTVGGILGNDNKTITSTASDKPIIIRDVFGGGYGSDDNETKTETTAGGFSEDKYIFTPMQMAGIVCGDTYVNIAGGHVQKNVYGGGELATVGLIDFNGAELHKDIRNPGTSNEKIYGFGLSWPYKLDFITHDGTNIGGTTNINITGGRLGITGKDFLGPYDAVTGFPVVNGEPLDPNNADNKQAIKNARTDNGDIYGGSKGKAGDRYDMAFCGNVKATNITINYPSSNGAKPKNYNDQDTDGSYLYDCVAGAVYGGGEDGHVIEDTHLTLKNGLIGHALYGGGSGKGKYEHTMHNIDGSTTQKKTYSLTAGKVYGNTHVKMEGGYVVRFVYGGGNMGSVGKGNYAGGPDDYYPAGYGETLIGDGNNLWTSSCVDAKHDLEHPKLPLDTAYYFLSSGKTKVEILGGVVGYIDTSDPTESMKDGLPYGSVFGGSRGESAPNIRESPRYQYSPEFFSGYVNETEVTIGGYRCETPCTGKDSKAYAAGETLTAEQFKTAIDDDDASKWTLVGPKILGSVFGGGQDGHVRRDTHVIVDAGEIGLALAGKDLEEGENARTNEKVLGDFATDGIDNPQWLHRGNVYGAGSGIGKYEYDFNADGDVYVFTTDQDDKKVYTLDANGNKIPQTSNYNGMLEVDYSTSAGSVTRYTQVDIHGGTIHRNVYGGGSLASVGPLKINQPEEPYKKSDTAEGHGPGLKSQCTVNIRGTIGTLTDYAEHYGGEVYGASRGLAELGESFANVVWTLVRILNGANVQGNVFGGGDNGIVKMDTDVIIGDNDE